MVLSLKNNNEECIEICNSDVIMLSGLEHISTNKDLVVDFDNVKKEILFGLEKKPTTIKFNNKKIYNHIKFYNLLGIKLKIKLDKIKNKYNTNIYYGNTIIHTCKKTIEAYFNYLVIINLKKYPEFNYLFYKDTGFFNDNLIIIDMVESNSKSNERFDMKIYFNLIDKSFGLECFEKHHIDKFDSDYRFETSRILNKKYFEKDVKFVVIFWYGDILDKKIFSQKFQRYVKNNFILFNKTKQDYCVGELNKLIDNKNLCESIYLSYESKNVPTINIKQINSLFDFVEDRGAEKYMGEFILRLKKNYLYLMKNNNKVKQNNIDFLLSNDSDDSSDSDDSDDSDDSSDSNQSQLENYISEEDYLKKYYYNSKLTFDGLGHYIQGLGFGNYLKFDGDKFRITEWYNKIMFALIKSFENNFDDLEKVVGGKNIFGLVDDEQ